MENHPIPQDITGFQFKLIGDMTIKQFAYLATGSVLAWIVFSLPIALLIKLPITSVFVLLGVGFAFFSLEGRPMDVMILNFIKTLFTPTQFVYQKASVKIETPNITIEDKKDIVDERESSLLNSFSQLFSHPGASSPEPTTYTPPQLASIVQPPTPLQPEENPEQKAEELKLEEEKIKEELRRAKEEEEKDKGTSLSETAHEKVLELEKLLNENVSQKQALEEELMNLRRQLEESRKQVFAPQAPVESQTVRSVSPSMGKDVGLPIASEYPNIISGIIKDPRGNPLGNILVEVKDKEGNPVRAFKTNPLGQFTASTPLTNGIYRIEFEDSQGKNKFEVIEFEAKGDIILPIEVVSEDTREELRKTLFN